MKIDEAVLMQDNQSEILLEEDGKGFNGIRTRHINIWYYMIKDRGNGDEQK